MQVRTVDGTSEFRVPPGTQPGDVIVLAKQGVPSLNKPSIRGDHLFTVKVTIPKRIRLAYVICVAAVHQEKEVGASQENNDKPNEEEGDWLKKLTDFAGSIANGAAKWLKDNL
ncbi:hypothetical protein PR202_ga03095 [Eleusine coracana subsp. coracana]|uniref:Chaperone DnaJ C-terminal domain-containing protein n=1 Tax=Eleusine coracana subsp. coracana TaxID=191504 RepID=A0AAV5BMJ0_ELECO|nr:hypothetical protein PR202_ga03095 [Eleusine coracana subsp. coracana]